MSEDFEQWHTPINKKVSVVKKTETEKTLIFIEDWWDKYIKNSRVSRNTEIFNYLQGAKKVLTDSIKQGATENGKTV